MRLRLSTDDADELSRLLANPQYYGARRTFRQHYRRNYNFFSDVDPTRLLVTVQIEPIRFEHPFLRVEFNPQAFETCVEQVAETLDLLLPNLYIRFLDEGLVSRIDITFDVRHLNLNSILTFKPHVRRTVAYYDGPDIQSLYYGASRSPKTFVVYDKKAEIRYKRSRGKTQQAVPDVDVTRFEHREKEEIFVRELFDIENPFANLEIFQTRRLALTNTMERLFIDSCNLVGCRTAMYKLSQSERRRFRLFLQTASCTWWDPQELWESWPDALTQIGLDQ